MLYVYWFKLVSQFIKVFKTFLLLKRKDIPVINFFIRIVWLDQEWLSLEIRMRNTQFYVKLEWDKLFISCDKGGHWNHGSEQQYLESWNPRQFRGLCLHWKITRSYPYLATVKPSRPLLNPSVVEPPSDFMPTKQVQNYSES